jgi:hypothetical protein
MMTMMRPFLVAVTISAALAVCNTDDHHPENGGYYIEGIGGINSSDTSGLHNRRADLGTWVSDRYYAHGEFSLCTGRFCSTACRTAPGCQQFLYAHTCGILRFGPYAAPSTVWQMPSQAALDSCDFSAATQLAGSDAGTYDYVIEEDHPTSVIYFASQTGCSSGQKVAVNIADFSTVDCSSMGRGSSRIQNCDCDFKYRPSTLVDPCHTTFAQGCLADMPDDTSCCGTGTTYANRAYTNGGTCIAKSKRSSWTKRTADLKWMMACNATKSAEYDAMIESGCPSAYSATGADEMCDFYEAVKPCIADAANAACDEFNLEWTVYSADTSTAAPDCTGLQMIGNSVMRDSFTASFTLSGVPTDYDTARQTTIKSVLAAAANVPAAAVSLAMTSGSVVVTATILVADADVKSTAMTALRTGIFASASALQTALASGGVSTTVEGAPVVGDTGSSGLHPGAIAAIGVSPFVVFLLLITAHAMKKSKSAEAAKDTATVYKTSAS